MTTTPERGVQKSIIVRNLLPWIDSFMHVEDDGMKVVAQLVLLWLMQTMMKMAISDKRTTVNSIEDKATNL